MSLEELKRKMKEKKPKFSAQDSHKKARIKDRWRKPRGSDSKMKQQLRGYRKIVKPGYGTPNGLKHRIEGLEPVMVYTVADLDKVVEGKCGIVGAGVGQLKKSLIVKSASEKKIRLINIDKDFLNRLEEKKKKKKEQKEKLEKEKKKKESEKKKKAEEKSKKKDELTEKVDEEEKKIIEKKEKDKALIQTE